jgi:ATP-binding cassette subfamily F protein 3
MISLTNVALRRGEQLLFQNVSLTIARGDKVGIVGANGSGKTSLFSLLTGRLDADQGSVDLPADTRLAWMEQEVVPSAASAVDFVLSGDAEYMQLANALAEAEATDNYQRIGELHDRMAAIDGYSARARAEQLMVGLGFAQDELEAPMNSFSGGWQIRLGLGRTLMQPSDLLLLDEPSNHLDLDAILWLSNWIRDYSGTLLLISHDRTFLDECVDRIASVHGQTIELYPGNYSAFERIKAARLAEQQVSYEKQQRQIGHMQDFVRRFRAKATKARQAQSRLKALERMELIAPAHVDSPFQFDIPMADRISSPLLQIEDADLGYDASVLDDVNISIYPEDRIGLLGHNGAGKSTLLKSLAGRISLKGGVRREGQNLRAGYFSQQQVDSLDLDRSAYDHIQDLAPEVEGQKIRNYLGGFDFHGDRVNEPVRNFSGGEKARVALAIVTFLRPNLLLMDEPTNHLDMEMCQALTMALQDFCEPRTWPRAWPGGAIVLISHDQHLLANTVDQFLLVDNGQVQAYDGDLGDYRSRLFKEDKPRKAKGDDQPASAPAAATPRHGHKASRQLRTRIRTLEQRLERLQRKFQEVETALSEPDVYDKDGGATLQRLLRERLELTAEIETVENDWLVQSDELEAMEQGG